MESLKQPFFLFCVIPFLLLTSNVNAEELFQAYHSDIQIFENGEMLVTETIVAVTEQKQIKRGIYRDFPLRYKDHFGNNYKVNFEIVDIKLDGKVESYHTKSTKSGIRIYIGKKNVILKPGIHTFDITYKTSRQLGFFDEYDELYWNVTGTNWAFPIRRASAKVNLPKGIKAADISLTGFTGKYRSRAQNFISNVKQDGTSYFETSKPLKAREGLTIVVTWPKGFVREPNFTENFLYVLRDNLGVTIGVIGISIILLYYLIVWSRVGKDPAEGVIFPHYEPPQGYSPASMRYIRKMGYDKTCFTVALINLAVKGYLSITEDDDGEYSLLKEKNSDKPLAPGEKTLLHKLLGAGSILTLKQTNYAKISAALDAHQDSLEKDYEKIYFITNSFYFGIGLSITFVILLISLFTHITASLVVPVIFMFIWLSIWSFAVGGLLTNAWHAWRHVNSFSGLAKAISASVFFAFFMFFEVMVFIMFAKEVGWTLPILIVIAAVINFLFYELLKAPTLAGRELLDKTEGFKRYIDVAEKHDLEYKYSGGKTPQLFERILPFAIALDIEQKWAEQFEDELSNAASGQRYSPSWYHGSNWHSNSLSGFSSSLGGSLSSAVSSAATAPGSSSGSGGFSGGGGGGGGGGGW